MLERSPIAEPGSVAQSGGNLVLPRLAALLSQQEKLLEHPLWGADLYLYDLRAQQIYDLTAAIPARPERQVFITSTIEPAIPGFQVERRGIHRGNLLSWHRNVDYPRSAGFSCRKSEASSPARYAFSSIQSVSPEVTKNGREDCGTTAR